MNVCYWLKAHRIALLIIYDDLLEEPVIEIPSWQIDLCHINFEPVNDYLLLSEVRLNHDIIIFFPRVASTQ